MINYKTWTPKIKAECYVRYFQDGDFIWHECYIAGETKDMLSFIVHTYHDDGLHFVNKSLGDVKFLPILSGGAIDTLYKLFEFCHITDSDLPSKSGMSELIELGLAFKDYDCATPNRITKEGISYFFGVSQ